MNQARVVLVRRIALLVTLPVMAGLTGCAGEQVNEPLTSAQFWTAYSTAGAMEANLPSDTDELLARATIVIKGTIIDTGKGPTVDSGSTDSRVPDIASTRVTVRVDELVVGSAGETVNIMMSPTTADEQPAGTDVEEQLLLFLEPAGIDGYYITASSLGVWGESAGKIVTLRNPDASTTVVPAAVDSVNDASRIVKVMLDE